MEAYKAQCYFGRYFILWTTTVGTFFFCIPQKKASHAGLRASKWWQNSFCTVTVAILPLKIIRQRLEGYGHSGKEIRSRDVWWKPCPSNSRTQWPWMSLSSVNVAFKSGGETLSVCACPVSEPITGISNFKHWKPVYFFLCWWRWCESKQARVPSEQNGYQWDYRNLRGVKAQ